MDLQSESALEAMTQPYSAHSAPSASAPSQVILNDQCGFPKRLAVNGAEEKFLCSYCQQIMRNPVQTDSGHRFCESCREIQLSSGIPCRACLEEGMPESESLKDLDKVFKDNAFSKEINKIQAKCINQGCSWRGTLQQYASTHENSCDRKLVNCSLCNLQIAQCNTSKHQQGECVKRQVVCPFCDQQMAHESLQEHKNSVCPRYQVKCSQCQETMERAQLKTHTDEKCPHRIVECPVPSCNLKLPLGQFSRHLVKNQETQEKHLMYMMNRLMELEKNMAANTDKEAAGAEGGVAEPAGATAQVPGLPENDSQTLKLHEDLLIVLHGEVLKCVKQMDSLEKEVMRCVQGRKRLEDEIRDVKHQLSQVLRQMPNTQAGPNGAGDIALQTFGSLQEAPDNVITWRIDHFSQAKQAAYDMGQQTILSPPFLTGSCGYRLRLSLLADGAGNTNSWSASIQVLRGPYDDLLPWPFIGKVYFILVDQEDFSHHLAATLTTVSGPPEFKKPQGDENKLAKAVTFNSNPTPNGRASKYLANDTVFVRASVDLPDRVMSRVQNLNPKLLTLT